MVNEKGFALYPGLMCAVDLHYITYSISKRLLDVDSLLDITVR